ncbi:MAG: UbiD family decarboxylase [Syntrophales bacterium]|nr:UbiD family decarboxylase [Syntrophales bacterium]
MAYRDLREYITALEKAGELQRVKKEVDWNLEIGAITRRVQDLWSPAPLFEKITGYPDFRILSAPTSLSSRNNKYARIALAFGISEKATTKEIINKYIEGRKHPIPPVVVKRGSCQENILMGDKIDLYKLPAPMIHEGDGGRYLCTWHALITKDPDTGWVNYGMYRQMIHDKNTLGIPYIPSVEHWTIHHLKNIARKRRTEVAVSIGSEPVTPIIAATGTPAGIDETDIIGGIRGEPLELVKCKTVDLEVPATSEIVIEGYIEPVYPADCDPHETRQEGPFGEYTGYRGGIPVRWPVMHVTAITHRNDAILTVSNMGVPVDDAGATAAITRSGELLNDLKGKGLPVTSVFIPPEGAMHFCAISSAIPYQAYARDVGINVWASRMGKIFVHMVMVTNEDVDVTDPTQVMWALTTRVHPERDIWVLPKTLACPLIPWATPDERVKNLGAKVLFDATWPLDWPSDWVPQVASFTELWPKEIQDKVLNSWKEYGFE